MTPTPVSLSAPPAETSPVSPSRPPAGIRRVLLVPQSSAVGGMETHCIDLAAEYVRRGIAVWALVPESHVFDNVAIRFETAGARVERLDTDARRGRWHQFARWFRLVRVVQVFRPDVVHLHTGGATGGLEVIATARLTTRAAIILTEHDVPADEPGFHLRISKSLIDACAHAVIAVSRRNAVLRTQRLHVASDQLGVVLNGVPIPRVTPQIRAAHRHQVRAELGLDDSAVVLGSVVRLADGKGLPDLLRAFALVRQEQACELLLVGDGPLREQLVALAAELQVDRHTHFVGQHLDPTPFMDAMDAFVLAVPAGSMSIALLEAMARGLAPIITFCGPEEAVIPEITGLGAPPNDPDGLAIALLEIVRNPALRTRLGIAAANHTRDHFSVARVADDLLSVYVSARTGLVPVRLRADAPSTAYPGARA